MRLIDADKIYPDVLTKREALAISQGQLAYAPTIEAIPKDQYEARLKADLVAMLEELKEQLREMHEDYFETEHFDEAYGVSNSMDIIQEKINEYKAESEDT